LVNLWFGDIGHLSEPTQYLLNSVVSINRERLFYELKDSLGIPVTFLNHLLKGWLFVSLQFCVDSFHFLTGTLAMVELVTKYRGKSNVLRGDKYQLKYNLIFFGCCSSSL